MARAIDADALKKALSEAIKDAPLYIQATVEQYIDEAPTLTPPNEPLTLEQAKKEKYIWFEPLKDWGKVTPDGVLFFGTEERMRWETLNEYWGDPFKVYRYPPEGEEDK